MRGQLSVVIPTYNRKDILRKTLEGYARQSAQQEILEILIVDDGSSDGTSSAVPGWSEGFPLPIRCLRQDNSGLAAARNHGIREARGKLVLFGDDDIVPGPDLVAAHVGWHKEYPDPNVAVLGLVTWAPEVRPTPFMEWLGLDGVQFGFRQISRKVEVEEFRCFYFCNTSLKTDFLRNNGTFDEDFKRAYEDIEFGYRLKKKGLRMLFNPKAIGYHYKHMSFADACRRAGQFANDRRIFDQKEAGKSLSQFERAANRNRWGVKMRRLALSVVMPALLPLRPLLDSQIPFPGLIYRMFYAYYTSTNRSL